MKIIYRIYSREHGITLAFTETPENAQIVKEQLEQERFQEYVEKCKELKKKMEDNFERQAKTNYMKLVGEIVQRFDTFEKFKEGMLNDKKYDEEDEICTCKTRHPQIVCDCIYRTLDSIEIQEVPLIENLSELRKKEE